MNTSSPGEPPIARYVLDHKFKTDVKAHTQVAWNMRSTLPELTGAKLDVEEEMKEMKLDLNNLRGREIQRLKDSNKSSRLTAKVADDLLIPKSDTVNDKKRSTQARRPKFDTISTK